MKRFSWILGLSAMAFSPAGFAQPTTVESVSFDRYAGRWFELARIPNSFQDRRTRRGFGACHDTTAEYALRADKTISVTNTCYRDNAAQETTQEVARAVAFVVPQSGGAKLKVNFTGVAFPRWLGIGNGDYWVLGLGDLNSQGLYSWVLVGSPSLKYGWILARDNHLDAGTLEEIWRLAESQGYSRDQFSVRSN